MLDLHFHLVIVVPERPFLINDLEVLVHIQLARRIDEYWTANLVNTKVAAWEIFQRLTVQWLLLKRHANVVNVVFFAIRHVVSPHFLDLRQFELPSPAVAQQESIIEPAVAVASLTAAGLDPCFELLQHAILEFVQISEVA